MSFASEIKKELTGISLDDCCMRSELAALVRMNGVVSLANQSYVLDVQTENAAIARRIYTLIKSLYAIQVELLVRKKMKLKKKQCVYRPHKRRSGNNVNPFGHYASTAYICPLDFRTVLAKNVL